MGDGLVRTALYDFHVSAGAKIVDHGYELPIWYSDTGRASCHTKFRRSFDVSHMGLFRFQEEVRSWLSTVSTQEYMKFQPGRCGYTHFLDHDGRIIDDMILQFPVNQRFLECPTLRWWA